MRDCALNAPSLIESLKNSYINELDFRVTRLFRTETDCTIYFRTNIAARNGKLLPMVRAAASKCRAFPRFSLIYGAVTFP